MAKNKNVKKSKKEKVKNTKLEIAEELNVAPELRPSKTGSVSQNTAKPVSSHKKKK